VSWLTGGSRSNPGHLDRKDMVEMFFLILLRTPCLAPGSFEGPGWLDANPMGVATE
jgi:hypothetical protein